MPDIEECYKVRSDITALAFTQESNIIFSTQVHGVKVLSPESCSNLKNLAIELLGYKTTAVAFSKDADLMAFANINVIYILNTQNKQLLQTIKTNEGEIEILSFVPNTKYIISGTKSGRVMQYRYDGRMHLSRLCSFGQTMPRRKSRKQNYYVSAFAFYENFIACAGYGGVIHILKMQTYVKRHTIENSKVRINALCFLDNTRIASGNIDGLVQIHSLKKYQSTKNIQTTLHNINRIILMPNPQYILVSADNRELVLIDTLKAKVASKEYRKFSSNVSNIELFDNNNIYVTLEKRTIYKVSLPSVEQIKSFIFHNDLDKAYELIESDPMLQGTREHKRVEVLYEKLYTQAVDALIQNNKQKAQLLMQSFSNIKSKKEDANSIFKAFEYYPRFKNLYLEKKYALAYAMAEKHPALKRTHQYKKMEETFKESFTFAQKQVLIGRADVAKEILSPYATVLIKKPILKLILNQNKEFLEFLKAIHDKEFATVEKLLKQNEIFSQLPTFTALQTKREATLIEIRELINKSDTKKAIQMIKEMTGIPSIKHELQELYRECKLVEKLQEKYEQNDFIACYEILDSSYSLETLELSQLLEKHWGKIMNECELFALNGDLKGVKKSLGELILVKTRVDKIGDLLRLSFHTKIKMLLAKRSIKNAENVIYSYIDVFGTDREIGLIMKTYEKVARKKLAITLNQDKKVPRDNWLHSSLIMG